MKKDSFLFFHVKQVTLLIASALFMIILFSCDGQNDSSKKGLEVSPESSVDIENDSESIDEYDIDSVEVELNQITDNHPDSEGVQLIEDSYAPEDTNIAMLTDVYSAIKQIPIYESSRGCAALFDSSVDTSYAPNTSENLTVSFPQDGYLRSLKIYGSSDYILSISTAGASIAEIDLATLNGDRWNTINIDGATPLSSLQLQFTQNLPSTTTIKPVSELEFWFEPVKIVYEPGIVTSEVDYGAYNFAGFHGYDLSYKEKSELAKASHIEVYSFFESEIKDLPIDKNAPLTCSFTLKRDKALIKNAFLVYSLKNEMTAADLAKKVNDGSWSGIVSYDSVLFKEYYDSQTAKIWEEFTEKINDLTIKNGQNDIHFYSGRSGVKIKDISIVVEYDNGWNRTSYVSKPKLFDESINTYEILSSQNNDLLFNLTHESAIHTISVHLLSQYKKELRFQVYSNEEWHTVGVLPEEDYHTGWVTVPLEASYPTSTIKISSDIESSGYDSLVYISEIRVCASPERRLDYNPEIIINFPRNGEYFDSETLINGFVLNHSGRAFENIDLGVDAVELESDYSFSHFASKVENGYMVDDESWSFASSCQFTSYYTSTLTRLTEDLLIDDPESISENSSSSEDSSDEASSSNVFSFTVKPNEAKTVTYQNVKVTIPAGAVKKEKVITITPLHSVASLDEGMSNVTRTYAGYRFLPHGEFEKPIEISFKYDTDLLSSEQKDEAVYMYYYNEQSSNWKRLERVSLDKINKNVVSVTNHFTDIINATLTVPDHPNSLQFNPNSIKDIKAGDPGAGISQLQAPKANQKGTVSLSYPIIIPEGRKGLQPEVVLAYNSEAGSSWLGTGWDIQVPSITVDTTWGVPKYDGNEIYLLDGEQLVYDADNGVYKPRVEGAFRKIEKIGNYWKVTDKSGTVYEYGTDTSCRLATADGDIFQWCLQRIIDTNGNYITYEYTKDEGSSSTSKTIYDNTGWEKLYLSKIYYTGRGKDKGAYSVSFINQKTNRPDITSSARTGALVLNRLLLDRIKVMYNESVIRVYKLNYTPGAFNKPLLDSVVQYNDQEMQLQVHMESFDYYDAVTDGNNIIGFDGSATYETGSEEYESTGSGTSINGYIGFAPWNITKTTSVGANLASSQGKNSTHITFADINGDGLSDFIRPEGSIIKYALNNGDGNFKKEDELSIIGTVNSVSKDKSKSKTKGVQAFGGISYNNSSSEVKSKTYPADVNGDGLVDFIQSGKVYFNTSTLDEISFKVGASSTLFNTAGSIDNQFSEDDKAEYEEEYQEMLDTYYLDDALRMWKAPFEGTIQIDFDIELLSDETLSEYDTADGVICTVQHAQSPSSNFSSTSSQENHNEVLFKQELTRASGQNSTTRSLTSIDVKRGDFIIFRLNSIKDGASDVVKWAPIINYFEGGSEKGLNKSTEYYIDSSGYPIDINGQRYFHYDAEKDFSTGGGGTELMLKAGTAFTISGSYNSEKLSDDVSLKLLVKYPNSEGAYTEEGFVYETIDYFIHSTEPSVPIEYEYSILPDSDALVSVFFESDTPVKYEGIDFIPNVNYKDAEGNDAVVTLIPGSVVFTNDNVNAKPTFTPENSSYYVSYKTEVTPSVSKTIELSDSSDTYKVTFVQYPQIEKSDNLYVTLIAKTYNQISGEFEHAFKVREHLYVTMEENQWYVRSVRKLLYDSTKQEYYYAEIEDKSSISSLITGHISSLPEEEVLYEGIPIYDMPHFSTEISYFGDTNFSKGQKYFFETAVTGSDTYEDTDSGSAKTKVSSGIPVIRESAESDALQGISDNLYVQRDDETASAFTGGYRNWYYNRCDGNSYDADETLTTGTQDSDSDEVVGSIITVYKRISNYMKSQEDEDFGKKEVAESNSDTVEKMLQYFSPMGLNSENGDELNSKLANFSDTAFDSVEDPTALKERYKDVWVGNDDNTWVGPEYMSSSRYMVNYIQSVEEVEESYKTGGRSIQKVTKTNADSVGLWAISGGTSSSKTKNGFMDLNGDRYPDIINKSSVQFTNMDGSLNSEVKLDHLGNVRSSYSSNYALSPVIPSFEVPQPRKDPQNRSRGFAASPGGTSGISVDEVKSDYVDINGDGLPDYVQNDGSGLKAYLNTGDNFVGPITLTDKVSTVSTSVSASISIAASFSVDDGMFSGSAGPSTSTAMTEHLFMDINGDGLPDIVKKQLSIGDKGSNQLQLDEVDWGTIKSFADVIGSFVLGITGIEEVGKNFVKDETRDIVVYLNNGNGFSSSTKWKGSGFSLPLIYRKSFTVSASGSAGTYFPIVLPPPVFFIGSIILSGGGGVNNTKGDTTVQLMDINGDGYIDHVKKDTSQDSKAGTVKAYFNNSAQSNLLVTARSSFGSTIHIDYRKMGNTCKLPQAKYVMSKVTLTDGLHETIGVEGHLFETSYDYEDGYYDRYSRSFYGFGKITETNSGDQKTVQLWWKLEDGKPDFYTKNMLKETESYGSDDYLISTTTHSVTKKELIAETHQNGQLLPWTGAYWPYITKTTTVQYESNEASSMTTTEDYLYDDYGNISNYSVNGGELKAGIVYDYKHDSHILSLPSSITVKDDADTVLRQRFGIYDDRGNLIQHTQTLGPGEIAVTDIAYNEYGMIQKVIYPENYKGQRYTLTYSYDTKVGMYITKTKDAFGYSSYASYDYATGQPLTTTDINKNTITYTYDSLDRLSAVFSPYDIEDGQPAVRVAYISPSCTKVKDEGRDFEYNQVTSLAKALVKNKSKKSGGVPIQILTIADGLKRVIQTKKESAVNGSYGAIVSGNVEHDALGRVIRQGEPFFENGFSTAFSNNEPVNPTLIDYDQRGRKIKVESPGIRAMTISYSIVDDNLVEFTTDPNTNTKTTVKDKYGNIVLVRDHEGTETRYAYNRLGEMTSVFEADNDDQLRSATLVTRDRLGRLLEIDNRDTGRVTSIYDTAGNQLFKITPNLRAKGQYIEYVYNYNRLDIVNYPESDDIYYSYGQPYAGYNRAGRMYEVVQGSYSKVYKFGDLGEVTQEERTIYHTLPTPGKKTYISRYVYDSLGRMEKMSYPSGEVIFYDYDAGGQLKSVSGLKNGKYQEYVDEILYDQFGQRTKVSFGNGLVTDYTYDPQTHRLANLKSAKGSSVFQNIDYTFDDNGNITKRHNNNFVTEGSTTKNSIQEYEYDNLDRLTVSSGSYEYEKWFGIQERTNSYESSIDYNAIGNITNKFQINRGNYVHDNSTKALVDTTYHFSYQYDGRQPHAVSSRTGIGITDSSIKDASLYKKGNWLYSYDLNGNMTRSYNSYQLADRTLVWDEENRLKEVKELSGLSTRFSYDPDGERVVKSSAEGETIYVTPSYTLRNDDVEGTHIFAGNTRVASKLHIRSKDNTVDDGIYYYTSDHLGSSSVITDRDGNFYEHIEYFPYGEVWVNERTEKENYDLPYKYTGKEYDTETKLTYYGARYYDAQMSRWISVDPILAKYLPTGKKKHDANLPAGGVFSADNLNLYSYAGNSPIVFSDPTGMFKVQTHSSYSMNYSQSRQMIQDFLNVKESNRGKAGSLALGALSFLPAGGFMFTMMDMTNTVTSLKGSEGVNAFMASFNQATNDYEGRLKPGGDMNLIIEKTTTTDSQYPGYGAITDHVETEKTKYQFSYVNEEGETERSFSLEFNGSDGLNNFLETNSNQVTGEKTIFFGDEKPTDFYYFKAHDRPSVEQRPSINEIRDGIN